VADYVLREFSGLRADRKATYTASLSGQKPEAGAAGHIVSEARRELPSSRLIDLSVAAGAFSRFRLDPRIPAQAFARLYQTWITRACLGELADRVLVASRSEKVDEPMGLITMSAGEGAGSIGLVAVAEEERGRGVGTLLMRAAHDWLARRGCNTVSVATQLDNRPACRLYEKCGYRLTDCESRYHFWPQESGGRMRIRRDGRALG
jgi:dTDP-4-amino-4,6-dideoxy-D-galactose acyltransferase